MQSRRMSMVEQVCNVGSGFLISLMVWIYIILPYLKIDVPLHDNVIVTLIFTVVSIIRGYTWRRVFNYFTSRRKV